MPRIRTGAGNWNALDKWDRQAQATGKVRKVFCASMADFFDNHPDVTPWRAEAWQRIKRCKHLRFQMLTKRIPNVAHMLPDDWNPASYCHVGFMITVVNQQEVDRDVPRLLRMKREFGFRWVGLSVEPMLGPIKLHDYWMNHEHPSIDWTVIGGESQKPLTDTCRPYDMEAALDLLQQVQRYGGKVFHKQLGSRPLCRAGGAPFPALHWKGEAMAEWPEAMRVQEFPQALLH